MKNTNQSLSDIFAKLTALPIIESDEIPGIDLYMDQVTTFMEECLSGYRRNDEEKILTKTMINNYAKNKLLPPPAKKKYSREHIQILVFIYYLKGVLSLQDIQSVLHPVTDKYFQNTEGMDVTDIYDQIFDSLKDWKQIISRDIEAYEKDAASAFPDADEEDQEFLRYFSLICSLSFDIYLKKKLIESLIDSRQVPDPGKSSKR